MVNIDMNVIVQITKALLNNYSKQLMTLLDHRYSVGSADIAISVLKIVTLST